MELSVLDTSNRQTQPHPDASGANGARAADSMFADLLLGIAGPAGDNELADASFDQDDTRDRQDDDTRADQGDDNTGREAGAKKDGRAVMAELADPLTTPAFGETADAKTVPAVATGDIANAPVMADMAEQNPAALTTPAAEQASAQANTPATTAQSGDTATSGTATARAATTQAQATENQAMAKRAGAIEANQAHKDNVKGQLAGRANQTGNDARTSGQPTAPDSANAAQAKAADTGAPTSDIARMEQAFRQAFPTPQAANGATAPGALAQPASRTSADTPLATRGGDSTIDTASAAANGNNRANAATAAARNASARPAFSLPNGRPAEQVSVQIQNGIRNGADRINIKLTPANLGNVEVKLEMAPDKTVQAIVFAEKAETLDMLERDGRVLQKALEDAGLRANSDSLSFQHRDSGQSANAGHDGDRNASSGSQGNGYGGDNTDSNATSDIPVQVRRSHDGLIDLEA